MPRSCCHAPAFLATLLALGLAACDNVGRAFDPDLTPDPPPAGSSTSIVQVVPVGGDVRDGRPKVRATYPADSGWPTNVPIVVEFSESVNQASIQPTSPAGLDGRVVVRVKGSTQALPCQYDFLGNGRLLVLRPVTALSNAQTPVYQVVLLPDARDADGVRFDVPTDGTVLSEFQVNQDAALTDGRILATFPRDNARDAARENGVVVVFDRPANQATLVGDNLLVRPAGGGAISSELSTPLNTVGIADTRVVQWAPDTVLAGSARHELVVTAAITFGQDGVLDFRGRTPFLRFDTVGPEAPTAVELANPLPGFANKINRANFAGIQLVVTIPASALAGDRVRVRVYGGDALTTGTGDLGFVERSADVVANGAQSVTLDFSGSLGTLNRPKFDDGSVTFSAQLLRGSQGSGFMQQPSSAGARFDLTPPTLVRAGPPASVSGADIVSDTEWLAFYGVASEAIASATLVAPASPVAFAASVDLFGSDDTGRFVMQPFFVGRDPAPRPYSLTMVDRAGNSIASAAVGNVVQRGFVTGTFVDTLTVEAYDQGTLRPIASATVLVDPGAPTKPATGQLVGTTDATGRVSFAGLAAGPYTVTIVRAGYDLISLFETQAAFVSLPLRPVQAATATLQGTVTFVPSPGTTAVVSCNTVDDRSVLGTRTSNAAPGTIPDLTIVPNRMSVLTAFTSPGEPTTKPTFGAQGYQMFGATLSVPGPPAAPAEPGSTTRQTLTLLPSTSAVGSQIGPYTEDFSLATGLDTANLVNGRPLVRVMASLRGFEGQVMVGLGFATSAGGGGFAIDSTWGLPAVTGYVVFGPDYWVTTEARDTGGRVSRHRALLDVTTGQPAFGLNPIAIPTITPPAAPLSASPALDFADVVDPLLSPGGIGLVQVTARAADGRSWRLLLTDRDAATGTDSVQFPDLATGNVAGLGAGTWTAFVEARLLFSVFGGTSDSLVLSERNREELLYARSATLSLTVP